MTYKGRIFLLILIDSLIVLTSVWSSYRILFPELLKEEPGLCITSSIALLCSHHFFAYSYKLYKKAWEYASIRELEQIFKAVTFSVIVIAVVQHITEQYVYLRILAITWMLYIVLLGGSRLAWRIFRDRYIKGNINKKRTLIVGAGSAGTMVIRQLQKNRNTPLEVVAFVDDNKTKQKLEIYGVPVVGMTGNIHRIVERYEIEHIIIAIPSLKRREINKIFQECTKTKVKTQIVPMLEDILDGKIAINEFSDVKVEDLLGRDPVKLDDVGITETIIGHTIVVTGAGGSIGSEICRQVMKYKPEKIVLLGHGENSIYTIEMELKEYYQENVEIIAEIADIQDRNKLFSLIEKHKPYIIYHAAAHKHVPLMERNPEEAVKNNIIGTKNIAEAADTFKVNSFVMVSTDKAVNPTSVMGATKRIAEMIVQHMDTISKTKFVAVRFGNVLGSRGSVIPLFKKQIAKGGPVTVTHPDMVRYFMTIPEASRLVIQAGALAKGGEIFVLDMGEPVKIVDLAKSLITLSGYTVEEIGIEFTGMRPGEKLYEELFKDADVLANKIYPKIYVATPEIMDITTIMNLIDCFHEYEKTKLKQTIFDIAFERNIDTPVMKI
ncbi:MULTISPECIES: polysaccharide biosynthesis protein [Bacillus]|uniref:polysaccharide biosynthesis protein n=1 Tax=Bacillus TaxID=1386 RepID=UPI0002D23B99|nr:MULTISPECIES: nucleoside-diphosphate sugar epimerase/dehydratase [Bacillus]MEB9335615.1 nucleoside-diphosphate sugar epimerase/dehydratase [Bacillus cereus]CCW04713.1 UDP-N-acetylglucosamine 4,6-dehydratase [Bacillus sp. GeD10]HEF1856257.1 polysaccharide biosynthesis protein [Bacillus cereus]HEF1868641.1 polysaccharide biosynthesis protein [Bacillus cereus]HEF1879145.1 polysaccharide biosynthesis protein [Bacillus cereus]